LELIVKAVSQTKKGIMVGNAWINADRNVGTFKDVMPGDTLTDVELSDDGKWVKAFKVKSGTTQTSSSTTKTSEPASDRDMKITRGNAANAGFAAFYQTFMAEKKSHEESLALALQSTDDLAKYIAEGL
jgi:hypothetical protein